MANDEQNAISNTIPRNPNIKREKESIQNNATELIKGREMSSML